MLGSYGAGGSRPHTEIELAKARQALGLLKAHREKGETAAQRIGTYILGDNKQNNSNKGNSAVTEFGAKASNSYYRKVFSPEEDEKEEIKTTNYKPKQRSNEGAVSSSRLQKVNANYNNQKNLMNDSKEMSHLANLGKKSLVPSNEFGTAKPEKQIIKRPPPSKKPPLQSPPPQQDREDDIDDRPIKSNKPVENVPTEFEQVSKEECRFCHRKFVPESLSKHEGVCVERPDKKKRKAFDATKKRMVTKEQLQLAKQSAQESKAKSDAKKKATWKQKSAAFRAALGGGKGKGDSDATGAMESEENSFLTKCPTCGRSFNDEAAKRHIPFCAEKAKKDLIRGKPKVKPRK